MLGDMIQFGFLPDKDAAFSLSGISYAGNLAAAPGAASVGHG